MSTVEAIRSTPEDLLTTPDAKLYELVDGQLVERAMGSESDWIGVEIITRLHNFVRARNLGLVLGPTSSYQCFRHDRKQVRKPDGSFIAAGRLPGNRVPKGHIRIVPDLALEVVSLDDSYLVVDAKIHEYLASGVRLVWVVNPDNRTVKVFRHDDRRPVELTDGDQLDGGDVLPGFSCAVTEILQPADQTTG
jgi:Uma2 family endonuclease